MQTRNLAIEFSYNICNILLEHRDISHSFYLDRVLEFGTHIFPSKIVSRIKFDASTPSESAVAPKLNVVDFGSARVVRRFHRN